MAYNFVVADREQLMLMPLSVAEWLPDDHLAWLVLDVVAELDLAVIHGAYRRYGRGGAAYDPLLMLAVLIYAYAIGERSSRRIERRLVEDLAFRVVAATQRPDHATIARLTDCQMVVLSNYGPNDPGYIGKLRAARDSAAAAGNLVIHVVTAFRTGHPEIAASNPTFAPVRDAGMLLENSGDAGMHPGLLPSGGDIVVTKRRISAFAGSDLEMILRSNHIDSLVLAGVATSGVILSTVRAAADLDYRILVVADGCYDPNPDLHKVLVRSIFPTQAEITDVDSWIDKAGRTHDLRSRPPRAHRFRVRALERSCRRP